MQSSLFIATQWLLGLATWQQCKKCDRGGGGGKGREGKGREGKGREGKGREGKGREGKGREGKGRAGKGRRGPAQVWGSDKYAFYLQCLFFILFSIHDHLWQGNPKPDNFYLLVTTKMLTKWGQVICWKFLGTPKHPLQSNIVASQKQFPALEGKSILFVFWVLIIESIKTQYNQYL